MNKSNPLVGIPNPEKLPDVIASMLFLAGNMSPERHRENGDHVRAEVAELCDMLGFKR